MHFDHKISPILLFLFGILGLAACSSTPTVTNTPTSFVKPEVVLVPTPIISPTFMTATPSEGGQSAANDENGNTGIEGPPVPPDILAALGATDASQLQYVEVKYVGWSAVYNGWGASLVDGPNGKEWKLNFTPIQRANESVVHEVSLKNGMKVTVESVVDQSAADNYLPIKDILITDAGARRFAEGVMGMLDPNWDGSPDGNMTFTVEDTGLPGVQGRQVTVKASDIQHIQWVTVDGEKFVDSISIDSGTRAALNRRSGVGTNSGGQLRYDEDTHMLQVLVAPPQNFVRGWNTEIEVLGMTNLMPKIVGLGGADTFAIGLLRSRELNGDLLRSGDITIVTK